MEDEPMPPFRLEVPTKSTEDPEENLSILPEPQTGNIEYKLKLTDPSEAKLEHLVTQLKWRIGEGSGEAIYKIGVLDNGTLTGISLSEMNESLTTLKKMAERLKATVTVKSDQTLENGLHIAEVEVRTIVKDHIESEIRIAVLGDTFSGKSTLVGVLSSGGLDNGRGKIRQNVLRHLHEIKTGRTSSVCFENLSISADGKPIVVNNINFGAAPDLESVKDIAKLITLIDLPGHRKYIKTTLRGIFGYAPDYAMFVLSSRSSFLNIFSETLKIISLMKIPLFIVITKTDKREFNVSLTEDLEMLLTQSGYSKKPYVIENEDDISKIEPSQVPVFLISNLTGDGIQILTHYLSILEIKRNEKIICRNQTTNRIEFHINDSFKFDSIGQIVIGKLEKGTMQENIAVKVGPFSDKNFASTCVKTLHRHGRSCREVRPGEIAAVALYPPVNSLRHGMVLVSLDTPTNEVCRSFEASLTALSHTSILYRGAVGLVFIRNKRQKVTVKKIVNKSSIRPGETGTVEMKFKAYPEYINVGDMVYFRGKELKCLGNVLKTFPL